MLIGVEKLNDTGAPDSLTKMVSGSFAKLFGEESLRVGLHAGGDGQGDRCAADVTVGSDGGAGDLFAGSRPGETRLTGIAGLPLGEGVSQVRLLQCDHRPVDEADEFLYNGLHPRLEDRYTGRYAVDRDGINACQIVVSSVDDWEGRELTLGTKIRLVEHIAFVVKTEEVAHCVLLLNSEKISESAATCRCVDPFQSRASCVTPRSVPGVTVYRQGQLFLL